MHDLKDGADIVQLIKKTKECAGEVILHTGEGDKLNLKSTLSQYVCVAMVAKPEILLRSSIECSEEDAKILADFGEVIAVRDVVTKALEDARGEKVINKSQEATVTVTVPKATLDDMSAYAAEVFEELFIVAHVDFVEGDELSAAIAPATGEKCPRCWNFRELGGNANHPHVCKRCGDALDAIGFTEAE